MFCCETMHLLMNVANVAGEFDMRVKSCAASDGGGHVIELSDEHGCVLRPKMISRFLKARINDERASVITYAFFHAFKFPDALSVHIKCKVEICRHGCLDHCQLTGGGSGGSGGGPTDLQAPPNPQFSLDHSLYGPLDRKDSPQTSASAGAPVAIASSTVKPPIKVDLDPDNSASASSSSSAASGEPQSVGDLIYDEMVNVGAENDNAADEYPFKEPQAQQQKAELRPRPSASSGELQSKPTDAHSRPSSDPQSRPSEKDAPSHWPYHVSNPQF